MTEEEAKQKWCPFARDAESNAAGYTTTNTTAKCIGSACMAWRCGTRGAVKHRETNVVRFLMPGDTYNPLEEIHFEADDRSNGYCGLAGNP